MTVQDINADREAKATLKRRQRAQLEARREQVGDTGLTPEQLAEHHRRLKQDFLRRDSERRVA